MPNRRRDQYDLGMEYGLCRAGWLPLLGVAAAGVGVGASHLSKRYRILLVVVGLAAIAITVIDNTVGLPMVVWFRD